MLRLASAPFKYHMIFALIVRLLLVIYSEFHDQISEVPYTDIDYKVFTDAARHIFNGKSPFERHTYRYTPLIAVLLIPNIIIHSCYGKVFFSVIDIIAGYLIRKIVQHSRETYKLHEGSKDASGGSRAHQEDTLSPAVKSVAMGSVNRETLVRRKRIKKSQTPEVGTNTAQYDSIPDYCMLFWIYNPMTVIISSRGNCDSVAVCVVLATIYYLQCRQRYFTAGMLHGLAIHIRLYPIIYSLSLFMYLSEFGQYLTDKRITSNLNMITHAPNTVQTNETAQENQISRMPARRTIFKKEYLRYLVPNYNQLLLICGCLLTLCVTISFFYFMYGYTFLYETYIYHFIRKDTRHNFSMFFYIQYLTAGVKNVGMWQKVLCVLPQLVLLLVLSVRYGLNKFTLHFSLLTQTIVVVTYNSVLTSQYFVWILAILPLTLWQFDMSVKSSFILTLIWFLAQVAWLLPAYLLEFHGQNTFLLVWLQSVSFFCANMAILGRLVKCFMYKNK